MPKYRIICCDGGDFSPVVSIIDTDRIHCYRDNGIDCLHHMGIGMCNSKDPNGYCSHKGKTDEQLQRVVNKQRLPF